jgi:hypothetical protein
MVRYFFQTSHVKGKKWFELKGEHQFHFLF